MTPAMTPSIPPAMIQVLTPRTLPELWQALAETPGAGLYAGGTDLLVRRRAGLCNPRALIHLGAIPALRGVTRQGAWLRLGAACTHTELLAEPLVQTLLPILIQSLRVLGSTLIRNQGTLGGNLCTASPAGDTLPPLQVLDAEVEVLSPGGSRRLPLCRFIIGPGQTALEAGEVLGAVWVPLPPAGALHHFEKVGLRNALACSLASLAALLQLDEGGRVARAALAWGSLGPTVVRCPAAEQCLIGRPLSLPVLREAADLARKAVAPVNDLRADAAYRRRLAGNLLLRLADGRLD